MDANAEAQFLPQGNFEISAKMEKFSYINVLWYYNEN
jgi:hypothetical protein